MVGAWDGGTSGGSTTQVRNVNLANEIDTDETDGDSDDPITGNSWIDPIYDKSGNMTTAPKGQAETTAVYFVYDGWNRVAGISSTASHDGDFVDTGEVQYLYDGNGRRIQKIFAGTATADQDVYFNEDFQALETRWNGSTNAYEQHVWDLKYIDAPILRYRDANGHTSSTSTGDGTSEEVLYFTFDANFNITGLVQENQTFVERYVYTPYGERLVLTGTFGSRGTTSYDQQLGHQGLYTDVESGTIYNRGRQGYHPGLGNFTQRDPIGYSEDGMNLYQYERSNPVNQLDPSGLCTGDFTGGSPSGVTGGVESTWEATKNLYNWLSWKWGSSNDRVRQGADDYYARLIRQEPQFGKDRQDLLNGLKKKMDDWLKSNGCKDVNARRFIHTGDYTQVIYSTDKSAWNPHNWFTGQLTLGRFKLNIAAYAEINAKFDGKNRVTGTVSVRLEYSVRDQFDPLGGNDPKQFTNVIQWTESGVTATIDCVCCNIGGGGGGGGKPALPWDGENFPI